MKKGSKTPKIDDFLGFLHFFIFLKIEKIVKNDKN
jgi:hypothetical protein